MLAGALALLIGYRELLTVVGTGVFTACCFIGRRAGCSVSPHPRQNLANRSVICWARAATCPRLCSLVNDHHHRSEVTFT